MNTSAGEHTVAVLGCGLMGSAVTRALARAGHDVIVWNRSPDRALALVGDRVRAAPSALEAVTCADVVISVLADYHALREVLGEQPPLGSRTLVNLSTGSPAQAVQMQAEVAEFGGLYLDGFICSFPEEIGQAGCEIYYAGDTRVYRAVEPILQALGGGLQYVGEEVGSAEVLDTAMVGMFFIPALVAFAESVAYLDGRGVGREVVAPTVTRYLGILGRQMHDVLTAVDQGDHDTDQATVHTYADAAATFLEAVRGTGVRSRLLAAAHGVLIDVRDAGLGGRGMSVVAGLGDDHAASRRPPPRAAPRRP